MGVLALRTELQNTLSNVLGTYTLPNGVTTPAIAVRAQGESLPAGTSVEGVECVIIRDPEPVELTQYRRQVAFHRWTLFLVDWTGNTVLKDVAGILLWAWPGSDATPVQVPKNGGPQAQLRVALQTSPDFAEQPDTIPVPERPVTAIRVDTSTAGVIYVGEAIYNAAESSPVWTIVRSTYSPAGIRTGKGTATGVTWTGRAGHTYS